MLKTLEYCSIDELNFDFLGNWKHLLHNILYMIFQGTCFSYYALLTDQISLPVVFTS